MDRSFAPEGGAAGRRPPRWFFVVFGYAVSIGCLIWVYNGFAWKAQWERLFETDWLWVTPALLSDLLVYVVQGWRWSVLLRPLAKVPVFKSTQAVYIGLFANEILPLRSGELIRCYLQRRWTGLPLSMVLSSAVIERMLDGYMLAFGFWYVSRYIELPVLLVRGMQVLVFLLMGVGALVVMAALYRGEAREAVSRSRWAGVLHHIVDGAHLMGRSRSFLGAAVLSFFFMAFQILPIYFLMLAYGLNLSMWEACVVLVVLRLGTVVPQGPGNVGSFQALTVLGLRLCGVSRPDATGFATLLFVVVTFPLWLGGFVALLSTRMRLDQIHKDAQAQMEP